MAIRTPLETQTTVLSENIREFLEPPVITLEQLEKDRAFQNKEKRMTFANKCKEGILKNLLFTDESNFNLHGFEVESEV